MHCPRFAAIAAIVVAFVSAATAHAQPPKADAASTDEELAEARRLFFAGVEAQEAGRCEEALGLYLRASRVARSPTLFFNIGSCHERIGQLIEAEGAFTRALDEARSSADAEVEREAARRLSALREEIPRVVLRFAPDTEDAIATLDEKPIASPIRVNPGEHRLIVRSERHERVLDRLLDVPARSEKVVDVDLGPKRSLVVTVPIKTAVRSSYTPALVATGAAIALGGAALVTGLLGHDRYKDYADLNARPTDANRGERDDLRSEGQTMYTANALLLGGMVVAVGVAIYFTVRPPTTTTTNAAAVNFTSLSFR